MHITRALLATCLTLCACGPASAQLIGTPQQPRPERPYRGIFAGGVGDAGQSLDATGSLSGGYDDNVLATATNSSGSGLRRGQEGMFAQASGGLNYLLTGARASMNASAATSQRYYPSLGREYFRTYNASLGGMVQVTAKPVITLQQSVSYRPYTFLDAFPGTVELLPGTTVVTDPEFVPLSEQFVAYSGGADLRHQLTRRTSFNSSWDYIATDRLSHQFWRQSAGANYSIGMTQNLNLRLGYRYTEAHYGDRVTAIHRPDVGIDFARALSLTRRTTVNFGIGTEASTYDGRTRVNAVGNASLLHEIGRSWTTGASYQRGTYFISTLPEPVTGDSASAQLSGLVTRRIQFQGVVGASLGTMGTGGGGRGRKFDSYRGSLSLSSALTRFMSVGLEYAYYKYVFGSEVVLDPGLARDINRQSVRAHVSFWVPIFNRTRRP